MFRPIFRALVAMTLTAAFAYEALACPFCTAVSRTFSEEIKGMDVAVIVVRIIPEEKAPANKDSKEANQSKDSKDSNVGDVKGQATTVPTPGDKPPMGRFRIVHILKGEEHLKEVKEIEVIYFRNDEPGTSFMVTGVDPPQINWASPIPLTPRGVDYLKKLPTLPEAGADRLAFFQEFFEDRDDMLARDAYDEFAKAPYADVKGLKERMHKEKLLKWIKDPLMIPSRRRLYLTMLGICGGKEDLPMLEGLIRSEKREEKAALDAMVACYLTLSGPDGLTLVEDLFLKNTKAVYTDTYGTIMALRFHGQEEQVIPRERLLASFRLLLDRPQLADLVIPDLARWQDWSAMEKMVKLFKEADEDSSWVRVPVVNFLRACPLPEAKAYIAELTKLDPEAVKRANSFFPFASGAAATAAKSETAKLEDSKKKSDSKKDENRAKNDKQTVAPVKKDTVPTEKAAVPSPDTTTKAARSDSQETGSKQDATSKEESATTDAAAQTPPATRESSTEANGAEDEGAEDEVASAKADRASAAKMSEKNAQGSLRQLGIWVGIGALVLFGVMFLLLRGSRGTASA